MKLLFALAMLAAQFASGGTFYVATNGNDSADGSLATPWLTIGHAATSTSSGDFVNVGQGTFPEFLSLSVNGVTFSGTRGTNGSWQTILDPSTPITNWYAAPEIGAGVFKATNSFLPYEVTIGKQRSAFVYSMGDISAAINNAYLTNWTTGAQVIALASNVTVKLKGGATPTINFWDGVGALWGATNDLTTNILYFRFASGADPTSSNICASPANTGVRIFANSVTVSNFFIRGSYIPVDIAGVGLGSFGSSVSSNHIEGGYAKVNLARQTWSNTIYGNEMTANYYGSSDIGAWGDSPNQYAVRKQLYLVSKFLMGQTDTYDNGIFFDTPGGTNTISANHIYKCIGQGINITGTSAANIISNTVVCGNVVENQASIGIACSTYECNTKVYSNSISDCNIGIRMHNMGTSGESNRLVYIYRNTSYLPTGYGDHIFMHWATTGPPGDHPQYWVYQNSFSGGAGVLADNGNGVGNGGMTNGFFLNNVMSGGVYMDPNSMTLGYWTNPVMIAAFDYNLTTPPVPTYPASTNAAWFGSHCITNATAVWSNLLSMSFQLPLGSKAIDAAIDTTASFTLAEPSGTNTYSALPKGGDTKIGSAWDIGALEWFPPAAKANSLNVINAFFK